VRMHAVLFDLYETLVSELGVPVRRASSLATQLGVDEAAYKREWKSRRPEILLGHYTFQQALAQIRDNLAVEWTMPFSNSYVPNGLLKRPLSSAK